MNKIAGVEFYQAQSAGVRAGFPAELVSYVVVDNEVRQWDSKTGTYKATATKAGFLRRQLSTATFIINKLF